MCGTSRNFPLAAGRSTWPLTTGPAKQDKLVEGDIIVAIILAAISKALMQVSLTIQVRKKKREMAQARKRPTVQPLQTLTQTLLLERQL